LDQRRNRSATPAAPARHHPSLPDGTRDSAVAALWPGVDPGSPTLARPLGPPPRLGDARQSGGTAPAAGTLALAPCPRDCGPASRSHRGGNAAGRTLVRREAEGVLPAAGGALGRKRRVSAPFAAVWAQ